MVSVYTLCNIGGLRYGYLTQTRYEQERGVAPHCSLCTLPRGVSMAICDAYRRSHDKFYGILFMEYAYRLPRCSEFKNSDMVGRMADVADIFASCIYLSYSGIYYLLGLDARKVEKDCS